MIEFARTSHGKLVMDWLVQNQGALKVFSKGSTKASLVIPKSAERQLIRDPRCLEELKIPETYPLYPIRLPARSIGSSQVFSYFTILKHLYCTVRN